MNLGSYNKNILINSLLTLLIVSSIMSFSGCSKNKPSKKEPKPTVDSIFDNTKTLPSQPLKKLKLALEIDSVNITDYAVINTSSGKIKIGLYGNDAPKTVANFIALIKKKYYDGILIHRIAKDFLIQMGDRNTTNKSKKADWGKGGLSSYGKPFEDELNPEMPSYKNGYIKGTIAMANRGKNTNTSQFFICLEDAIELEKKWTIFGKVINGLDIVEKINSVPIEPGPFEQNDGFPIEPIKIYSIYMER